jgi:hypothetical protein
MKLAVRDEPFENWICYAAFAKKDLGAKDKKKTFYDVSSSLAGLGIS